MLEPNKNKNLTNNSIMVFGEILADVYPEYSLLGGAPFNVARHLRAFGLSPILISRIGKDVLSGKIINEMQERALDISGIQYDSTHPSGQVKVTLNEGLPTYEILKDQAYDFIQADAQLVASVAAELFYFGTLAQRSPQSSQALHELLSQSNSIKFLDLNLRKPWYTKQTIEHALSHADIVKLNEEELEVVSELFDFKDAYCFKNGFRLTEHFQIKQLLVTTGASGSWTICNQKLLVTTPSKPSNPILDTVGAGDAFSAVFIHGYINDWDMPLTLSRANQFATAICGIRGAVPESPDFYRSFIADWQ